MSETIIELLEKEKKLLESKIETIRARRNLIEDMIMDRIKQEVKEGLS